MAQSKSTNVLEKVPELVSQPLEQVQKAAVNEAENIITQAREQINFLGLTHPLSNEVIKQKEDEDIMRRMNGYKQKLKEIDKLLGIQTDESALDEKIARWAEEERKRLFQSFHSFKLDSKQGAEKLDGPEEQQKTEAQEEQKEELGEQEEKQDKIEKQNLMNQSVESNSKTSGGIIRKGNRSKAQRRPPPKTGENRIGQGGRE